MPRRGTNIYKRKDGRWEGRVLQNTDAYKKRKYISIYGKTYQEVKDKTEALRQELKKGNSYNGVAITMQDAVNMWLNDKGVYWKTSTHAAYFNIAQKYILPVLGQYKVTQIGNPVMAEFLAGIRCDKSGKKLSNGYLRNICSVVIMVLSHAKKKYGYKMSIPENPVMLSKQKQMILPSEQNMAILEAYLTKNIKDDTCLGILIAFYTGIRIGELCALTWENIDLKDEVICIRKNVQRVTTRKEKDTGTEILFQEPKTATSMRIIPIPPILLPYIKENRPKEGGYVIKGKKKPWTEPRTLQYRFAKILQKCSIKEFHFHALRHAFATRCIDKGFDIKTLSEILGHSNVQITLNLYVHSSVQRKKQLMNLFTFSLNEETKRP